MRDDRGLTRREKAGQQSVALGERYGRAAVHAAVHTVQLATSGQPFQLSGGDAQGAGAFGGDEAIRGGEVGCHERFDTE